MIILIVLGFHHDDVQFLMSKSVLFCAALSSVSNYDAQYLKFLISSYVRSVFQISRFSISSCLASVSELIVCPN